MMTRALEAEAALLEIVRQRLDDPEIGVDDDFYAMGGDSLVALRVVADAQGRGIEITLRDLLYHPTVRELAAVANRMPPLTLTPTRTARFALLEAADRALLPVGVADAYPASAMQVGILYLCEAAGDPRLYHSMIGMEVTGPFDEASFRAALFGLVARHAALRSSFDLGGLSAATQLVWSTVEPPLTVQWLSNPDSREADRMMHAWRKRELERTIDWGRPPLVSCHVVALPASFRFALAAHHAIVDGWSFARLLVDLLTAYNALLRGDGVSLPVVPDGGEEAFLRAERESVEFAESAAFWQAEADAPPLLAERARFSTPARDVGDLEFDIDGRWFDELREAARRAGVALKSLAQGTLVGALGEWTGRTSDIVMGTAVNTRPEIPGADLLVGLFLNTVPVRFATTQGSWVELARLALDAERRTLAHRRYPLVHIEQRLGRPAFDVSFNFATFHVYRDLAALSEIRAGSRWVVGKPGFPLIVDFEVDEADRQARIVVQYDLALVSPARAERLAGQYRAALLAVGGDPAPSAAL